MAAGDVERAGAPPGLTTARLGTAVFLASDVMLFAPFFAASFLLRTQNQPWPPDGVHLDTVRAALATAVLVVSSLTLQRAHHAAARPDRVAVRRWLLVTMALGLAFLVNQLAEYAQLDFSAGDHVYGSVYWLLTGLHAAHVTAGLGALAALFVRTVRAERLADVASWSSGVGQFWHLVDVIWLFVFVTIWVIR